MALTSITKDFIVRSGLTVQATNAVTSSTGQITALQVNSGAAVAKNLIVGTTATIYGITTIASQVTADTAGNGALRVLGGASIEKNLVISDFTSSTSTTATNSFYTAGGAGIAKDLTVGGDTVISGNLSVLGVQTIVNSTVTALQDPVLDLGTGASNSALIAPDGFNKGVVIHYYDTLASTEKVTALVRNNASGNMSLRTDIANPYTNSNLVNSGNYGQLDLGTLTVNDSTSATNDTSGALQVAGGAGIQGALYAGATSYVLDAEILTTATIANYNVSKVISGNGIGVNRQTGEVTVTNTGVVSLNNTDGFIDVSTSTGSITINSLGVTQITAGNAMSINGVGSGTATTGSVTIDNMGVTALNAGTDTSLLSGATTGSVTLNVTSTLESVTGRGASTTNAISITNATASTDTNTGALTVAGGVGIGGALNASQTSYVNGSEILTTATIANYQGKEPVAGTGINITTGTQTTITNIGVVSLEGNSDFIYVSISTGTVQIDNLGVREITAGNALSINGVGTNVSSTGSITIDNIGVLSLTAGNALSINGFGSGLSSTGTLTIDNLGVTELNAGTDTSLLSGLSTGSVTINVTSTLDSVASRGASSSYAISITDATASTNATSGALTVTGGVGVGGDLNAGGNLSLGSNLSGPTTITSPDSFTITATNAGANIDLWSGPGGVVNSQGAEVITTATIDNYTSKAPDAGPGIRVDHTVTSTTITNIGVVSLSNVDGYIGVSSSTGTITLSNLGVTEAYYGTGIGIDGSTGSITITNTGVTALNAGTDTSLVSGLTTGSVTLNVTSTLQSVTERGATTDQAISITNSSPTALSVTGGISVGGTVSATTGTFTDVNSTGTITANAVSATTVSATTVTTTDIVSTGTATFNNLTVTGTFSATNLSLDGITIGNLTTTGTNTFTNLLTVGVPTTATVVTSLESNNMQMASYTSDVINTSAVVALDAFDASIYRTTRYVVQVFDRGSVHISEMTVYHDGTLVFLNEYGISYGNNGPLGVFDANWNGNMITLQFTPNGTPSAMTIKVVTMSITL
jgi:hypothetical protein